MAVLGAKGSARVQSVVSMCGCGCGVCVCVWCVCVYVCVFICAVYCPGRTMSLVACVAVIPTHQTSAPLVLFVFRIWVVLHYAFCR
jgi:hypothetical protein